MILKLTVSGIYPPYIENIQRDMRISVENEEHILLMGYTLPKDDVIYRSMFPAKINRDGKYFCSVVVGKDKKLPDKWIYGNELEKYIKNISRDDSFINAVSPAFDIFGVENVRGYGGGIPDVFLKNGRVDEGRVKNLIKQW